MIMTINDKHESFSKQFFEGTFTERRDVICALYDRRESFEPSVREYIEKQMTFFLVEDLIRRIADIIAQTHLYMKENENNDSK